MRILMFGMSSYPGGIENYIYNYFVNAKMRAAHTVDFITYEPTIAYEEQLNEIGYRVHKVPHLKKKPVGYFHVVRQLFKANNYDCVYINMLTAANVLPVVLAASFGVKRIILHAHANATIQGFGRRFLHHLNKGYCGKKSTLRLACSEAAGRWLFGERPFETVPNAIDCDKFRYDEMARNRIRNQLGIKKEQLVIGHVGRIAEEKNHLFMLRIMKEILKTEPTAKLVFVGDGYLADTVKAKVGELGLQDAVVFYGTTDQAHQLYSVFDVFLFPSTFEGFGMAALEAQACGLKVFCSDTLSPQLNVTGSVSYLNLNDSPEKWAERILKAERVQPDEFNARVRQSDYNIEKQIERLSGLIYG